MPAAVVGKPSSDQFDVCIVGAGVIGLAIAWRLSIARHSRPLSIVLLEQEASFGQHISSRNSEVIHAGIYYPPDSLKARLCLRGRQQLYEFCEQYSVPHRRVGKYIVAQTGEQPALEALHGNALASGVNNLKLVDKNSLLIAEPALRADHGMYSPDSGIIDSHSLMQTLLTLCTQSGTIYSPRSTVMEVSRRRDLFIVSSKHMANPSAAAENYQFSASVVINSCGLEATKLAAQIDGLDPADIPVVYPCKGSYYSYSGKSPFQHLIYPLPEPGMRGLGIHATLDMAGQLRFGPNAEYIDKLDYAVDCGLQDLYSAAIRRYFPALEAGRLLPTYSGIRPKLSAAGDAAADFLIQDEKQHGLEGLIQLFGIESPGLTASLAIAETVEAKVRDLLGL